MQVVDFLDFLLSILSVHFILYRKDKIRTDWKKSGWLVTLCWAYVHSMTAVCRLEWITTHFSLSTLHNHPYVQ
jgi:hypothetical protein